MKISSSHKDYYDAGMQYGVEPFPVYSRFQKVLKPPALYPHVFRHYTYMFDMTGFVVGFCGRLHLGYHVRKLGHGPVTYVEHKKVCYSVGDVDQFVEAHCNKDEKAAYAGEFVARYAGNSQRRKDLEARYRQVSEDTQHPCLKLFEQHYCPVFVIRETDDWKSRNQEVTLNDCLKPLEFIKVVDPFQAYQQISMFLGGLACPDKDIPNPPDEILCEIKGFDPKMGFRKKPTKRKR